MIPLAMIVLDELRDDLPEVPLTEWNDAIETFFRAVPTDVLHFATRVVVTQTDGRILLRS
jgi:hypothetical protein